MDKNFTLLAQNGNNDYVKQACLCAMSIHATNPGSNVSLITNDNVQEKYRQLFDHIVEIPWGDHAEEEDWKISNRWKIYHATPYSSTMVLDTDMLVLQNIDKWFEFLDNYDLFYTSNVLTYRGETISSDYYRKAFTQFKLPNLYSGLHYFKERPLAKEFYAWMEMITNNWQLFYKHHAGGKTFQKKCSMDLTAAITAKIMHCEDTITSKNAFPTFVHMKSKLQNWEKYDHMDWQKRISVYQDDNLDLYVGNYKQSGIFHYTEKDFANENIITTYEKHLGI